MKTVILAAGAGKRLKSIDFPKPLTRLRNGKSILQLQLETLSQKISLDDVLIVVGYHKDKVIEQFPDLLYVYNPLFASENTAKSLLRALRKIDDDVLWINGDVVFHPDVLQTVLACKKNCMAVNDSPVGDEEIKYHTDGNDKILEVSKQVVSPEGEALGINFFTKKDLGTLKNSLAQCQEMDYFEKAIEMCILNGVDVWTACVDAKKCTEIDFPEDLEKANQMLWN